MATGCLLLPVPGGGGPRGTVSLNLTTPLLTALAVVNIVLVVAGARRPTQLSIAGGIVVLAVVLLKDWVEGLVYLLTLP